LPSHNFIRNPAWQVQNQQNQENQGKPGTETSIPDLAERFPAKDADDWHRIAKNYFGMENGI